MARRLLVLFTLGTLVFLGWVCYDQFQLTRNVIPAVGAWCALAITACFALAARSVERIGWLQVLVGVVAVCMGVAANLVVSKHFLGSGPGSASILACVFIVPAIIWGLRRAESL